MRAMVVRTIIAVHMALPQGSPALGTLVVQSTEPSSAIERLEW